MEIFGFSAAKIVTILIIAIVIFGPDKVSEMARTVGRTIRDVRRYMNAMTAEFNDATGELQEEFAGIAKDLQRELTATQADLRSQLDLTSLFADDAAEAASPAFLPPDARAEAAPMAAAPMSVGRVTESSPAVPPGDESVLAVLPTMTAPAITEGMGSMRRPTKAAPLADFAVAPTTSAFPCSAPSQNEHRDAAKGVIAGAIYAVPGGAPSSAPWPAIGRSVAGSTYVRGKVRAAAPGKGLCRSACVSQGANVHGFTASHATAATLIAAP